MRGRALLFATLLPFGAVASEPLDRGLVEDTEGPVRHQLDFRPLDKPSEPLGIWNGTTAPTFTSVGAIVAYWETSQGAQYSEFCSGTLVHPRWFVTAGHCVTPMDGDYANADAILIVWNQDIHSATTWTYSVVTEWHHHPGYADNNPDIQDDIGVLKLQSNAPVPTQGVLLDNPDTYKGEMLTYVGYGVTGSSQTQQNTSGIRRKTEMELQGCGAPDGYYPSLDYPCGTVQGDPDYEPQFLLGTASNTNICSGDSGGAAMREMNDGTFLLVGVNSYTAGSCESGESGATRVDFYESWLESTMGVQLVGTSTAPTDTGGDTGVDTGGDDPGGDDTDVDSGLDDTGFVGDDPERPPEGAYDRGFLGLCQVGPSAPAAAWLVGLIGLLPLIRRRRS